MFGDGGGKVLFVALEGPMGVANSGEDKEQERAVGTDIEEIGGIINADEEEPGANCKEMKRASED